MERNPEVARLVVAALARPVDAALWAAMLREDLVYAKIPADLRQPAMERAVATGRQAALECGTRHGTTDPIALVEKLGIRLVESDAPYVYGKLVQTSTYVHRTPTITLYTGAIEEMNRFLADQDLAGLLGIGDVRPVYLAHELFHHLEEASLGRAATLVQVITFRFGPLTLRSGIAQLSEIAADAFAQRLLDLPVAPRLLDYLTVWIHNEAAGLRGLTALAAEALG
jgi:hypothetical protein